MFEGFARKNYQIGDININLVRGGSGFPVLLLHGYPQSHVMWHKIAPKLAEHFTVIAPDLRGYGDSSKPRAAAGDHEVYCKRSLANDIVQLMSVLDQDECHLVGHDRGARVGHRMALDHPELIRSFTPIDVVASQAAFDAMDAELAYGWFHWHLMRQPYPFPETLIGNSVNTYFNYQMDRWCLTDGAVTDEAYAEYQRCFCNQEAVDATCAEYRSIELDLKHDEADRNRKLDCPVLVLWGTRQAETIPGWQTGKTLNMVDTWRARANDVRGLGIDCGHFVPEERPDELAAALCAFYDTLPDG
jgi:haloacetate dehalogenase